MIPGNHSDTRIKPLPFSNGHGRYTTATPERRTETCVRWGMAAACGRYKILTVSLLKRLRDGCFASETATWIQKLFKIFAETPREP
jgi:hypothetical protein